MTETTITTVASIIQLAIAPVFLLAGIGGILNVVAQRLARVVDRARKLEADLDEIAGEIPPAYAAELKILDRRMSMCHGSIGLCTAGALLVCIVIMVLFVADLVTLEFGVPVSLLFIGAMLSVSLGLVLFLAEVTIATRSVRVSDQYIRHRRWTRFGGSLPGIGHRLDP